MLHFTNTLLIWSSAIHIFCSSWPKGYHGRFWHTGWKPWHHCFRSPQKPLAWMSAVPSSVVTALFVDSCSPASGCSNGSTETLWYTSVIRLTVMSLISLWRIMGNSPVGQLGACSILSSFPHRQCEGSCFNSQPYLKHTVFRKALLCKVKPWSCIGRAGNPSP